jgi:hypothetical protein
MHSTVYRFIEAQGMCYAAVPVEWMEMHKTFGGVDIMGLINGVLDSAGWLP